MGTTPIPTRGAAAPAIATILSADRTDTGHFHPKREASLRPVAPGVHVPDREWAHASAETRHLTLVGAAAAKYGDGLVLAGASAALILGLPVVGRLPSLVQCVGAPGERRRTSLLHRRVRGGADAVEGASYRCTGIAVTCIDLARWGGLLQGVCAMDHALHIGTLTRPALEEALETLGAGCRHARTARTAVRLADPRSESPGESLSRVRMWWARLPEPELQHEFWTGKRIARTDFHWPGRGVVAEFDGALKYHRASFGTTPEETVMRERERERALRRLGLDVARWTWGEAWRKDGAGMLAELAAVGIRPAARRW